MLRVKSKVTTANYFSHCLAICGAHYKRGRYAEMVRCQGFWVAQVLGRNSPHPICLALGGGFLCHQGAVPLHAPGPSVLVPRKPQLVKASWQSETYLTWGQECKVLLVFSQSSHTVRRGLLPPSSNGETEGQRKERLAQGQILRTWWEWERHRVARYKIKDTQSNVNAR